MDLTKALDEMAAQGSDGLYNTLGMEFFSTDDPLTCKAAMPVDGRTIQPWGYLCGGATLALAEILAGLGSIAMTGKRVSGMNVSCNHIHSVPRGETVTAIARNIHKGNASHVWIVEVRDKNDRLVSNISVTNFILD